MSEYHSVKAFAREEPRVELIEAMLKSVLAVVDLEFEGRPVQVYGFRLRELEDWRTVQETSLEQNLGSLSTVCNCRCRFCYEDGNPAGLFEKDPRFVSVAEAVTRLRHLHDGKGLFRESKGFFEPLANPDFIRLLELIREHDPELVIDVTTNGALLTEEMVSRLAALRPVFVNVSLISADESKRRGVMGDGRAETAIRAIELLRSSEIPFMGTLVPWPEQGLQDVEDTIRFLDAHEARMIRVSMPGLTRHHPRFEPGVIEAWLPVVKEHVLALRTTLGTPVIISPFAHVTADPIGAIVEGVIRRSPAAAAGFQLGDRVTAVDGTRVVSRAHAASLLDRAAEKGVADVELLREGATMRSILREVPQGIDAYPYQPSHYEPLNFPGMRFGLCLPDAFHLQYLKQIHAAIHERGAENTLVLVSHLYHDMLADLLVEVPLPDGAALELLVPRNEFFGGNVNIGDLWVLEDIARAVQAHVEARGKPDLIVLPSSFLSRWGRDLLGVPYTELETALGVDVALVKCQRIVL